MKRREFIAVIGGATILWPLTAGAQRAPVRIGVVSTISPRSSHFWAAFEERLSELGHRDGQDVNFDFIELHGDIAGYPGAMTDLVQRGANVIVASGGEVAAKSAREATRTTPIVLVAIDFDPIVRGYISGLAHPGGNMTGVFARQPELVVKRLELFKAAAPQIRRVLVLWDSISADQFDAVHTAGKEMNLAVEGIELRDPPYRQVDFETALAAVNGEQGDAVMSTASPLLTAHAAFLADLARRRRLPLSYPHRDAAEAGALLTYGINLDAMFRLAADYVDKIIGGAKPADLPVQQPTKYELIINLKTAEALGLTIPPSVLARADEVIE